MFSTMRIYRLLDISEDGELKFRSEWTERVNGENVDENDVNMKILINGSILFSQKDSHGLPESMVLHPEQIEHLKQVLQKRDEYMDEIYGDNEDA